MNWRATVVAGLGAIVTGATATLLAAEYQRACSTTPIFRFWECWAQQPDSSKIAAVPPEQAVASPPFVSDGWTSAGVYDGERWSSRLLSFPHDTKPEDLVGVRVTPTQYPGNYLRSDPPSAPGSRGSEIGTINVGDQLEIGKIYTLPSTTGGVAVWASVRRMDR